MPGAGVMLGGDDRSVVSYMKWMLVTLFGLLMLVSVDALAAPPVCNSGEAPSPYDSAPCNVNNYGDVCQFRWDNPSSSYIWDCYVDRDQGNDCGEMTAVTDYDGSSPGMVSVWGVTSQSSNFCCTTTNTMDRVQLNGAQLTGCGDELKLNYNNGAKNLYANSTVTVLGWVNGQEGPDEIEGSYEDAADYADRLYGGSEDDTITCNDGDDFADGGDDNDVITGGQEADELHGGPGNDELNGDEDDDDLYGGTGMDIVCGGPDTDWVQGDENNDILDGGGQSTDTKVGGLDDGTGYRDECDRNGTNHASCETIGIQSSYSCP